VTESSSPKPSSPKPSSPNNEPQHDPVEGLIDELIVDILNEAAGQAAKPRGRRASSTGTAPSLQDMLSMVPRGAGSMPLIERVLIAEALAGALADALAPALAQALAPWIMNLIEHDDGETTATSDPTSSSTTGGSSAGDRTRKSEAK
jgi:hypothetical protein